MAYPWDGLVRVLGLPPRVCASRPDNEEKMNTAWDTRAAERVLQQDTEIARLQRELRTLQNHLSRIHDLAQSKYNGMDGSVCGEIVGLCRDALKMKWGDT